MQLKVANLPGKPVALFLDWLLSIMGPIVLGYLSFQVGLSIWSSGICRHFQNVEILVVFFAVCATIATIQNLTGIYAGFPSTCVETYPPFLDPTLLVQRTSKPRGRVQPGPP